MQVEFRGRVYDIEVAVTPIFMFKCPKCGNIVYEGVVAFDMEMVLYCDCGYKDEAWYYPHTIKGTNYWTSGAHYTNNPLVSLPLEKVLEYFFWETLPKEEQPFVHG